MFDLLGRLTTDNVRLHTELAAVHGKIHGQFSNLLRTIRGQFSNLLRTIRGQFSNLLRKRQFSSNYLSKRVHNYFARWAPTAWKLTSGSRLTAIN
jgi:hypothetical protein